MQVRRLQPRRWSGQVFNENVDDTVTAEPHAPHQVILACSVVNHHFAFLRSSHRCRPVHEVLLQTASADRSHSGAARGKQETGARTPIRRTRHTDQGGKNGRVRFGSGQLAENGRKFLHGAQVTVGSSD